MGGSCLARVYDQGLIHKRAISSGHDISDTAIAVTLLEMAFAGNCSISVDLRATAEHDTSDSQGVFIERSILGVNHCTSSSFYSCVALVLRELKWRSCCES